MKRCERCTNSTSFKFKGKKYNMCKLDGALCKYKNECENYKEKEY